MIRLFYNAIFTLLIVCYSMYSQTRRIPVSSLACASKIYNHSMTCSDYEEDIKFFQWDDIKVINTNDITFKLFNLYIFPDGSYHALINYESRGVRTIGETADLKLWFKFYNSTGQLIKESNKLTTAITCNSGNIELMGDFSTNLTRLIKSVEISNMGCLFSCRN